MRVAVAGGTGTVGRHVVTALEAAGHEPVVLTRGTGVDLVADTGLEDALEGVAAVVDVANRSTLSASKAEAFFSRATGNLVAAAQRQGVGHVVLLSIIGIDRIPHNYYAGKRAQEAVVRSSAVPWTILRTTQFHEFAGQILAGATVGPIHLAPRARIQPVAAAEVAARLAVLATGPAVERATDLAGPREERLDRMIAAYARHTGTRVPVIPALLPGRQGRGMRAGLALPDPEAERGVQTFDEWLAALPRPAGR